MKQTPWKRQTVRSPISLETFLSYALTSLGAVAFDALDGPSRAAQSIASITSGVLVFGYATWLPFWLRARSASPDILFLFEYSKKTRIEIESTLGALLKRIHLTFSALEYWGDTVGLAPPLPKAATNVRWRRSPVLAALVEVREGFAWEAAFNDLLERAAIVVVDCSRLTKHIKWELNQIVDQGRVGDLRLCYEEGCEPVALKMHRHVEKRLTTAPASPNSMTVIAPQAWPSRWMEAPHGLIDDFKDASDRAQRRGVKRRLVWLTRWLLRVIKYLVLATILYIQYTIWT